MNKENKNKLIVKLQKMAKRDVPFWEQVEKGMAYDRDPNTEANFSKGTHLPMYNLSCTRRDLHMYVKHGMKPTRHWKVSDVKHYFGITGSGGKLLDRFNEIYHTIMPLALPESYAKNNAEQWQNLCNGLFLRCFHDGSSEANYLDEYV